jgi:ubiquinone/menaquinone biosynthesis C-methylase UbiE
MPDDSRFRADLFHGTATYYDRFRVGYPRPLIEDLLRRAKVTGHGRLLDLACGTGQLAFALAGHFAEVWAVDLEPEMIARVQAKAATLGTSRLRVEVSAVEDLLAPDNAFELVTMGNAFHRVDREAAATNITRWLQPGGWLALAWSDAPWDGEQPWQVALSEVLQRWKVRAATADRVPAGWAEARLRHPDEQLLAEAGLRPSGRFAFTVEHRWTTEALIGFVYSASFLPRHALGEQAADFEAELARCAGSGALSQPLGFAYELYRREPELPG